MNLYVSKISLFNSKEGTPLCRLEGIRYKKESEGFKGHYANFVLRDYPSTWHTDNFKIPFRVRLNYDVKEKKYIVLED